MNKDQFKGIWNEMKGNIKQKWGKLTDDDLTQINGQREALLGKLQQRYGKDKEAFEEDLNALEEDYFIGAGTAGRKEKSAQSSSSSFSSKKPSARSDENVRSKAESSDVDEDV